MLGFIFGLNARIGRLHYFLSTIGLAIVMTGLCVLIALAAYHANPHGTALSFETVKWPVIGVAGLFIIISLTLQSMRFRDIGWDPVCVIPGWIAVLIIDFVIARKFPGLALGAEHHGTALGAVVNLGLSLALLFWPSGDQDDSTDSFSEPRQRPDPWPRGSGSSSVTAARIARPNGEFGRRSF